MSAETYKICIELDELMMEYLKKWGKYPKYFIITQEQYLRLIGVINYRNRIYYGENYKETKELTKYRDITLIIAENSTSNINFIDLNTKSNDLPKPINNSTFLEHLQKWEK